MKLKVFVPDWDSEGRGRYCTPLLYPFVQPALSPQAIIARYGDWVNDIVFVNSLAHCDIAILKYELHYYYRLKKTGALANINKATSNAGKLLVCTVKEDTGITPPLLYFHLYRWSGYTSKNKGNQFAMPVFISDPVASHYPNSQIVFHEEKTAKPLVGFCGQGRGGLLKLNIDIARSIYQRILQLSGIRFGDAEPLQSSTYTRSVLLDALEKSPLINTHFTRYKKYRNASSSREEKESAAKLFFQNITDTQYTFCYRGAGNFSVRLFETLACGRIPVIILSDNLLPLPKHIDWNRFPVVQPSERKKIAETLAAFHDKLSNAQFVQLQQYARQVWETYLTYNGFMRTIMNAYMQNTTAKHSLSQ